MRKVGVIGERDSVLGFKAVGFDVYPVISREEASERLTHLADSGYAVIYITEQFASMITEDIERYRFSRFPAIVPIPGNQGSLGIGMSSVKKSVEKAVGADILFKD
ncbi:MAG: V-type ATP synthase subunit F [Clostridiaceae bacterium]|jgi:V/A-type H+-transporting ATPase subunit F|nr:V-type ATP synthase subunit F [Bacillota bacterium]NLI38348.1 V-type ATP synthase subunit F [Clostridiaceae bacterium]